MAIVKTAQQEIVKSEKAQNIEERTSPEDNKPVENPANNIPQTEIPEQHEYIHDYDLPPEFAYPDSEDNDMSTDEILELLYSVDIPLSKKISVPKSLHIKRSRCISQQCLTNE